MCNKHKTVADLDKLVNWSGSLCKEKLFNLVNGIKTYRYSLLTRAASSNPSRFRSARFNWNVECLVRENTNDDWEPLFHGNPGTTFLKFTLNLKNTPSLIMKSTSDVAEVNDILHSKERRVNLRDKMKDLYQLRDRIFTERID